MNTTTDVEALRLIGDEVVQLLSHQGIGQLTTGSPPNELFERAGIKHVTIISHH